MPTFYGAIDLSKNELRNAVIQNLASPPTGQKGQVYFDSTANVLYWHNGTTWVSASGASPAVSVTNSAVGDAQAVGSSANYARQDHVHGREAFGTVVTETTFGQSAANGVATTVARSDHTHGTPAAPAAAPGPATTVTTETVGVASVVGTATTYAREDHRHGWIAATTSLDMGNFAIVNLADPSTAQQAATKNYVDNAVTGMSWKNPVRVTGGPITNFGVLSGLLTVDGVTLVAGDRVLLCGQSTASSNGIYVAAAGAWSRATDNDSAAEMLNASVYVSEGTTYADTAWVCTTNAPITIGTTPLTWAQFAGSGSVVAGAGMTQAGNTLNVIAGDTSLVVNADEVHVNTAVIATVASLSGYQPIDTDLTALAALATTGIEVRTGAGTQATRSIAGTAPVTVTNGDGVAGNPTVAVSQFTSGAAGVVPASGGGTTFLRADGVWASPPGSGLAKASFTLAGNIAYATGEVLTHNLNTRDVQVTVINNASPYNAVEVDWEATTVNTVTVRYNPATIVGYRAVVIG